MASEPIYYFVDIEATGVDLRNDRIIQLAFLKMQGSDMEAFNDLCYTDIDMNDTVVAVHHITNAMLEDKYWPYETDAFIELEEHNSSDNYFVSHGNKLDVAMLQNEELDLEMALIDTDRCARVLLPDEPSYALSRMIDKLQLTPIATKAARRVGIDDIEAHDAMSDAIWHYAIFSHLLELVDGDVQRLVQLTQEPIILERISFGKHKGKRFEDVMSNDPNDMVWMYLNMTKDWPDLEHTLEHWLQTKQYFWNRAQQQRQKEAWFD